MLSTGMYPCPAVQRWEDAHSCLLSALTSYMDTCTNLKNSSLAELATNVEDLVPRIERHITSLGSFVACQVSQTCSILSTTRNRLVSLAYGLPEEVLVEIFAQVIYDPTGDEHRQQHPSLDQDLRSIYRRLYNLIGVCSSWRNIAIRKRSFWSIVPIIDKCECSGLPLEDVTERSLRRSSGAGLYIAANSSLRLPVLLRPLISYGKRIWALNIKTDSLRTLEEVVSILAVFFSPKTLSELSMYLNSTPTFESSKVIKQPVQHQERLKAILGSLRTLRMRIVLVELHDISFTNLVELRLENICYKPVSKWLLRVISSAPNLQYLRLVSLTSCLIPGIGPADPTEANKLSISLPKLKVVYLSDLYYNDLRSIFESFVPGNEKWILSLGDCCQWRNDLNSYQSHTAQDLGLLLQRFNVETLRLSGLSENWLGGPQLSQLLKAVPNVTTLKMDRWDFHREHWEALTLQQGSRGAKSAGFPSIHNFHIYNSQIFDEQGVQAVVSSHNIQQLRLGGVLHGRDGNAITDKDNIAVWLASNVPNFCLMGSQYSLREFPPEDWRLW
ncbi:unnamed protein product [Rhizoctonia solani]|uniref:F-box domain-containing protein n=1 Tax=Rhizoctonia solani TaxID=456999 RepID=A0A8H3HD32_9AGAM|nr:unnamed protein product [Rhizoctonia solani]